MPRISTTKQNFNQIGLGVSVLRMRDFAPPKVTRLLFFGGGVEKGYTETRAPKCLLGVAKPKSKVSTPISPKTAIFGPHFNGT